MLAFEKVSLRSLRKFLNLSISEEQRELMYTSNVKTLFQSLIWTRYSKLFLILNGDCAVGYVFIYCHRKSRKYDIGRLLIDKRFQNQGFGKQALLWAMDYLYDHHAPQVLLSVHPDNRRARKLYESVGFSYCDGRYWGDEMVMIHRPSGQASE